MINVKADRGNADINVSGNARECLSEATAASLEMIMQIAEGVTLERKEQLKIYRFFLRELEDKLIYREEE